MKMKTSIIFTCLFGASFAVPVYHQQYGLSASNSNEFMRYNGNAYKGVGYGQPQVPYMPPYVYQQQQPDMGLPSQLPLNPQVAGGVGQGPMQPQGPLSPQVLPQSPLPPQGNMPPQVLFPPSQKAQSPNAPQQPLNPWGSNVPQQPQQPNQVPYFFNPKMLPSYYPSVVFPQQTGGQESTAKRPPVLGTETMLPTTAPGQLEGNVNTVTETTQPGSALPFEP